MAHHVFSSICMMHDLSSHVHSSGTLLTANIPAALKKKTVVKLEKVSSGDKSAFERFEAFERFDVFEHFGMLSCLRAYSLF